MCCYSGYCKTALGKESCKQIAMNLVFLLLLAPCLLATTVTGRPKSEDIMRENIKTINDNLDTYKGIFDFDIMRAKGNLIKTGDECLDEVGAFMIGLGNERNRRIIGSDILFRIDTDKSRAALFDLFQKHYSQLQKIVSPILLSYPSLNFEKTSPQKQNDVLFAYYIFQQALLRSNKVGDDIAKIVPQSDRLFRGLMYAHSILFADNKAVDTIPSDDVYIVQGMTPFLKKIRDKLGNDSKSLEKYRSWYLSALKTKGDKQDDLLFLSLFFSGILSADSEYVLRDDVFAELVEFYENENCRQKAEFLRAKKRMVGIKESKHDNDTRNTD